MKKEYKWEKRKRLSLRLSLKEGSLFIAIGDNPFEKYRTVKMQEKEREAEMLEKY